MKKFLKISVISCRIIPFISLGLFLVTSCTTTKEATCPEFPDKRNYSIKYRANYQTNRNDHKNQSLKKRGMTENQILILIKKTYDYSVDFTININTSQDYDSYKLTPFPHIASELIEYK